MLFKWDAKMISQPNKQAAVSRYGSFSMMATEKATPTTADIARGSVVRVMRPESFWFQECGTVATIDKKGDQRYGTTVRFEKVNYAGVATNNFALDELVLIGGGDVKAKA